MCSGLFDVRYLLTLEFVSMMTDKWRGAVKRPWKGFHVEAYELLQTAKFHSTGQVESGLFAPWSPMWKGWVAELYCMDAWKAQLH